MGMLASLSKDLAAQDWLCFFIASSVSSNQIKKIIIIVKVEKGFWVCIFS